MGTTSRLRYILRLALVCTNGCAVSAWAVSASLYPVGDTTLIETSPDNSNGGDAWVNSGTTQNGPSNRGLFRFDLTSIPTNATIESAQFVIEVTRRPSDGYAIGYFGLRKMFRPWGAGTNIALDNNGGLGAPAVAGDATWNCSFHPTNFWSAPGGASGVDFSDIESSSQQINSIPDSPYTFPSTPELVADVQSWVQNPETNFGWMLICNDEGIRFTARRFGSSEDGLFPPRLDITFSAVSLPVIDSVKRNGETVTLSFVAQPAQLYTVQYTDGFATNAWHPLSYVWTPTTATRFEVTDTAHAPQRFYRLATSQ